jgi:hypothetical protein
VYAYDYPRTIGPAEREQVKAVFADILEELSDVGNTSEMFVPYGIVANFVLANRRIQRERAERSA